MKKHYTSLIMALGAALLALPAVQAADSPAPRGGPGAPGGPGGGPREMRGERMRENMGDRMAKELGLSDDQKAKMKVLGQAERAEMEALRDQSSKLRDEQRAKFESIHKGYMEKRQAIMTPEQREKAGKMREQMRGKMQERMERMHDRGERRRGGPPGRT